MSVSEGFLLSRSSAGAELRVPVGCAPAAGALPVGCRCIEILCFPKENLCFSVKSFVFLREINVFAPPDCAQMPPPNGLQKAYKVNISLKIYKNLL